MPIKVTYVAGLVIKSYVSKSISSAPINPAAAGYQKMARQTARGISRIRQSMQTAAGSRNGRQLAKLQQQATARQSEMNSIPKPPGV